MTGSMVGDTLDALRPEPLRYAGYRPCTTDDGVLLYYRPRGRGQSVVFINNLFQDPALWMRCGRLLTDDHRVVTFDLRNQGMSGRGRAGSARHARDVIAILDALGVQTACLFGHSYGTRVALDCALSFPTRVEAVVLCSPIVHPTGAVRRMRVMHSWRRALVDEGAAHLFDTMWPVISSDRMLTMLGAGEGAAYDLLRTSFSEAIDTDGVVANLDGALEDQSRELDLTQVDCPVLLIAGEDDCMATPGAMRELHDQLADTRATILNDSAHLPYLDDPQTVADAVRGFVAERSTASRPT